MKNINKYINESIFDIDDKTIVNKRDWKIKVDVEFTDAFEKTFKNKYNKEAFIELFHMFLNNEFNLPSFYSKQLLDTIVSEECYTDFIVNAGTDDDGSDTWFCKIVTRGSSIYSGSETIIRFWKSKEYFLDYDSESSYNEYLMDFCHELEDLIKKKQLPNIINDLFK